MTYKIGDRLFCFYYGTDSIRPKRYEIHILRVEEASIEARRTDSLYETSIWWNKEDVEAAFCLTEKEALVKLKESLRSSLVSDKFSLENLSEKIEHKKEVLAMTERMLQNP